MALKRGWVFAAVGRSYPSLATSQKSSWARLKRRRPHATIGYIRIRALCADLIATSRVLQLLGIFNAIGQRETLGSINFILESGHYSCQIAGASRGCCYSRCASTLEAVPISSPSAPPSSPSCGSAPPTPEIASMRRRRASASGYRGNLVLPTKVQNFKWRDRRVPSPTLGSLAYHSRKRRAR